ncbi:MAG: anti-sigma factor family protein [Candidatus Acidiferrales bacterium]
MNCKGVIRELSNYIDGDLDLAMKQELERHLGHCKDCTMIVDQTKKTVEIFCDSEPIALPSDMRARLHEALHHKMKEKLT